MNGPIGPILVLDEQLQGVAPSTHYTSADFNGIMGRMDKISLMGLGDDANAAGTVTIRVEHSADGRNWVAKSADIANGTTAAAGTAPTAFAGSDDGATVNLPQIRLRITLNTSTSAHLKLWATGRSY